MVVDSQTKLAHAANTWCMKPVYVTEENIDNINAGPLNTKPMILSFSILSLSVGGFF